MSQTNIPPSRGGSLFEVTLLPKGIDPRKATTADFVTIQIIAPNAIAATIFARNENDAAIGFDARKV